MNFKKPSDCLQVIRLGDTVEANRGYNRTKVLDAANGKPPLSADQAAQSGVTVNVNFLELLVILWHARSQLESAFLRNQYFFTVKIPSAPIDYRAQWESRITAEINRALTKSREYFELHRSRWASVVTHGVGPMGWFHPEKWLPRFIAMNDLRIPTDTTTDFKNLTWYAVRISYTQLELVEEAFSKKKNNHWNKRAVKNILKKYKDVNATDPLNNYDWETDSEKFAELIKQNGALYGSDAVPVIPLFHFYYQDENDSGEAVWRMRIVPDRPVDTGAEQEEFLWESDDPIAPSWKEMLHCQFGDLSTDAPFKYHSVRGLGFLLLEPCFFSNLTRCKFVQHTHESMDTILQVSDNPDKARAQVQEFGNLKVLQHGVRIVPQNERHQIDPHNVESVQAQMKQLMGEASASFTQAVDNGTAKEQTAFEVRVKMEQVNAMMSGILLTAFKFESYAYQEICRRFCIDNSSDKDVQKFRKRMLKAGIPEDFLDIDLWEVDPVTPLGSGNPTIALSIAQQLMEIRPLLNPEAQNQVLHDYILTITKDPARALQLAPLETKTESEAAREATGLFGALMTGVQIPLWGSRLIEQIDQLLPMLAGKITIITRRDNMATLDEAAGLMNAAGYINQATQQLSQDRQQKARVKEYTDLMGRLTNEIKGLIQRGQQSREAQQQGQDQAELQLKVQEAQLKMQTMQATTQHKLQSDQAKTAQSIALREQEFAAEQQRLNEQHLAELRRQNVEAAADIARDNAATAADIQNSRAKAAADAENARRKAQVSKATKSEE